MEERKEEEQGNFQLFVGKMGFCKQNSGKREIVLKKDLLGSFISLISSEGT